MGVKYTNDDYFGFLLIDKPKGLTSHDVVAFIRRRLGCKVGHTGTLDPFATGLLIIALGKATRLCDLLQKQDKEYLVTMILGEDRDTYDTTGSVINRGNYLNITQDIVLEEIKKYIGSIWQIPPAYSAIKVNGKRAYELARKGKEFELDKRKIVINTIKLEEFNLPEITIRVNCSSGTYIRTLVHDIGVGLGCYAYAINLRRTMIRDNMVEDAICLETFLEYTDNEIKNSIISPVDIFNFMPQIKVNKKQFIELKNGRFIDAADVTDSIEIGIAIYDDKLIALINKFEQDGETKFKPEKVFSI